MAILSFWSGDKKETGQTLSIVAIATYMSVEHNYKTLIIDATLDDDTIERCNCMITIPMAGRAESLNASAAAAIICYAIMTGGVKND